jgi:ATP-dependent DNA helicase DinG
VERAAVARQAALAVGRRRRAACPPPERAEKWLFARLPEWEEVPERPQPAQVEIPGDAIEARLAELTGEGAESAPASAAMRERPARVRPARTARRAAPAARAGRHRDRQDARLSSAGLAVGRASQGTVWVSTYTKNLQRQLRRESRRAWPETRADGSRPVVVRKGRENYLCLLNLEDALQGASADARRSSRSSSRAGRVLAGRRHDRRRPAGWLGTLFRNRAIRSLTDQRGECV